MSLRMISVALALCLAVTAQARPNRTLLADSSSSNPNCNSTNVEACIVAGIPSECSDDGLFDGNQWEHDEIECHVCDGDWQLKCDLDTDIVGDDSAKCKLDWSGLASAVNNGVEFDCKQDEKKRPENQCDWAKLEKDLPGCALEPVRRIMASWTPSEYFTYNTSDPAVNATGAGMCNNTNIAGCIMSGTPGECSDTWGFDGNQWSGDEIECHVCNNDYQLKCDLDTDLIGDDSVKCEVDWSGAWAFVSNAVEFECKVDSSKSPPNQCDWEKLQSDLPGCTFNQVRRIMATWKPDE